MRKREKRNRTIIEVALLINASIIIIFGETFVGDFVGIGIASVFLCVAKQLLNAFYALDGNMRSNCLRQALRHRIKGCPAYKVTRNDRPGWRHYVWWDKSIGSYRHFTWDQPTYIPKSNIALLFYRFDGRIEEYRPGPEANMKPILWSWGS